MLDRHFTATTYIINKSLKATLLHLHEKLDTYLPPGGHIEKNETPKEAAKREILEETGISDVEFIEFSPLYPKIIDMRAEILSMPYLLLKEQIEENHYHLDWIFFAYVDHEITMYDNFAWFTIQDLQKEKRIFQNVRSLAIHGLEKFG